MSQPEGDKLIFLDTSQLGDDPEHGHLCHHMLGFILFMVDSHQRADEVKFCEELVDRDPDRLEGVYGIVVLDELIVRSTHPWEAEKVSKGRIHQH